MILMDGKTRRKLILEAKKYGGIAIPHQKLQVHQNGAKFPISKVYVDDEQLDPSMIYTLVIIPEGFGINNTGIVLTHFDAKLGPVVIAATSAEIINDDLKETCGRWMASSEPGFFTASSGSLFGSNYLFEIESTAARTGKETIMLSLVTNKKTGVFIEDIVSTVFLDHVEQIKKEFDMYMKDYAGGESSLVKEEKSEFLKARTQFQERLLLCLNQVKAELDRSLEIQEKIDLLRNGNKTKESNSSRD